MSIISSALMSVNASHVNVIVSPVRSSLSVWFIALPLRVTLTVVGSTYSIAQVNQAGMLPIIIFDSSIDV